MKPAVRDLVLGLAAAGLVATPVGAHPGSGIVADRQGRIYFIDTGAGVWRLDTQGALTRRPGPAFHWMTIDPDDRFAKTKMPSGHGWEIARTGGDPTLLLASDFPMAIGQDGNLYYPSPTGKGGVQILRMTPAGGTSVLASLPVPWVNGLAAGPDGCLYVTENRAIRKIDNQGRVMTVAGVAPANCASIPGSQAEEGPLLRGLDVDARGTIFVAAAGCGSVLKVTPDGQVASVVQTQAPWSPTAVVKAGNALYVLEYLHVATEDRRLWLPRIRKISADGTSAVIATVNRE